MYRGKSFLLPRDYTAHCGALQCLADARWARFWDHEFGSEDSDANDADELVALRWCIGTTYQEFGDPSDTLATKILLGALGCIPACDRYFKAGFAHCGFSFSYFNGRFVKRVLEFCRANRNELRDAQSKVHARIGTRYPLMKLVDMYFFQTGLELAMAAGTGEDSDIG